MRRPGIALVVAVTLLVTTVLAGCSALRSLSGRPANMDGMEWVLESLNGKPLVQDSNITLNFENGRAGGYAGCNWYGWDYRQGGPTPEEPKITLTLRLCTEPAGVMEQEAAYVEALRETKAFEVKGDRLEVKDAEEEIRLVFRRRQALSLDPAKLVSTRWQLQTMAGQSLLAESRITLTFERPGQVSGHAGCRDYRATYEAGGDHIRFPFLEMVQTDCTPEGALLQQEGKHTTYLGETTHYRLSENRLELLTASGKVSVFAPLSENP
jgi:heat shock protein HslJ